ncbi:MAG TPA: hypothetical protein EYN66_11620 [Myxococcales bacterium]|nr:hypothetical protein [Myxococcales bacterium]
MQKQSESTNTTMRAICAVLFLIGCAKANEPVPPPEVEDLIYPAGTGLELPCKHTGECRPGLACTANQVCGPAGTQLIGQACAISAECQPGSYCESLIKGCRGNISGELAGTCEQHADCPTNATEQYDCVAVSSQCKEAGGGRQGDVCSTDGHCISGLSCAFQMGFFGFCTAGGAGDIRTPCTANSDCQAGLICGPTEACMSLLELGEYYEWEGTTCETNDKGAARAYFELPNPDGSSRTDFFRLPFPNDIRLASGHAATSFPSAGPFTTDIDPVGAIATRINQELKGWSPAPTVVFRFSRALDYTTLQTGPTEPDLGIGHDGRNIFLVNIDSDSTDYGREHGYTWGADTRSSKTLCGNWLTINPGHGAGLKPGDTYAVVLLKGFGVADSSQQFNADNDLTVVLSDAAPADTAVARPAWEQYGSLRAFLGEKKIASSEVLNAAVFTVQEDSAVIAQARQIIRDLPPPQVISSVLCKVGVSTPCSGGVSTRACGENEAYYEIQGQLQIPVFQTGEAPYLQPEDGGGAEYRR